MSKKEANPNQPTDAVRPPAPPAPPALGAKQGEEIGEEQQAKQGPPGILARVRTLPENYVRVYFPAGGFYDYTRTAFKEHFGIEFKGREETTMTLMLTRRVKESKR